MHLASFIWPPSCGLAAPQLTKATGQTGKRMNSKSGGCWFGDLFPETRQCEKKHYLKGKAGGELGSRTRKQATPPSLHSDGQSSGLHVSHAMMENERKEEKLRSRSKCPWSKRSSKPQTLILLFPST